MKFNKNSFKLLQKKKKLIACIYKAKNKTKYNNSYYSTYEYITNHYC